MNIPESQDLQQTFELLSRQTYRNVKGVSTIEGEQKGKTVVISTMTHGNEINSLAAIWYLLKEKEEIKKRLKGKIILTLNNIEATSKYFEAETSEEKRRCRKKDIDLNRLPKDFLSRTSPDEPYEIKRAQELYPVWQEADFGLDLHGTVLPSEPMIIDIKGEQKTLDNLSDGIALKIRIENITPIQIGYPIGFLFGGVDNNIPVFEIETGWNEDIQATANAIKFTISFLIKLEMLEGERCKEEENFQEIYQVIDAVMFPDISYRLIKKFPMFEPVKKGEVIATGNGEPIIAKNKGHAIFSSGTLQYTDPKRIVDERLFLTQEKRQRKRTLQTPLL